MYFMSARKSCHEPSIYMCQQLEKITDKTSYVAVEKNQRHSKKIHSVLKCWLNFFLKDQVNYTFGYVTCHTRSDN